MQAAMSQSHRNAYRNCNVVGYEPAATNKNHIGVSTRGIRTLTRTSTTSSYSRKTFHR